MARTELSTEAQKNLIVRSIIFKLSAFSSCALFGANLVFHNVKTSIVFSVALFVEIIHRGQRTLLLAYDQTHFHFLLEVILIFIVLSIYCSWLFSLSSSQLLIWSFSISMWMVPFSQTQKRLGCWQH